MTGHKAVVGVDLSLTGTGLVSIGIGEDANDWYQELVRTKGTKSDTLYQRQDRLNSILKQVHEFVLYGPHGYPSIVVIESPSFGSQHGAAHDRSGLWWLVVSDLRLHGVPVATVTPNGRAKYGTGKGNAPKDEVLVAAVKAFPWLDIVDNNVGDAAILAAMGARWIGEPVDEVGKPQLDAMDGAAWPS